MKRDNSSEESHPRKRILEASIRLFAEYGYENTNVATICKEAKVNRAMVSYYYGGKLDLFRELIENITNKITQELREEVYCEKGPEERLKAFIEVFVRNNLQHPELIDIATREVGSNLANSGDIFKKYFLQVIAVITDVVQLGMETGVFIKKMTAIVAAIYIFASVNAYFVVRRLVKNLSITPSSEQNKKEYHIEVLYQLVSKGISAE